MIKWSAWALLLVPTLSYGAQALIMGEGRVLSTPDYVELGIQVQSRCYSTPKEAREANDEAASKIIAYLNKQIQGEGFYNKVVSEGGYTQPYSTYHRNQVLCENTFQKNNNIRIRTQQVSDFQGLFDGIQKEVYKHFETQPRGLIESAVTFVTMSAPSPQVSTERKNQLERDAMSIALKDAQSKLQIMFAEQPIKNLKITEISELQPHQPPPMPMMRGVQMMSMDASSAEAAPAPVQFDDQWIHKVVYFRFSFDDVDLP